MFVNKPIFVTTVINYRQILNISSKKTQFFRFFPTWILQGSWIILFFVDSHRVLWGIVECFKNLSHFPSGPEVHPEAGHGTATGQADHTGGTTATDTQLKGNKLVKRGSLSPAGGVCVSSYLRQRVFRGCPLFRPVARYSKSSVNSWFSPNSTTSLKCFTCWTTVYNWETRKKEWEVWEQQTSGAVRHLSRLHLITFSVHLSFMHFKAFKGQGEKGSRTSLCSLRHLSAVTASW